MATVNLLTGDSIKVGGVGEVFGTGGSQSIEIEDGSNFTFRSGFNSGASDNIRLDGKASDFKISTLSISNAVLTSTVDNISVTIPIGTNGINVTFDNGDTRVIKFVGSNMVISGPTVADFTVTTTPTSLQAGPAFYSITGAAQATEGTDYTFVAHRTSDGVNAAQVFTFNVQGDTNGGTVPAATTGADFNIAAGNSVTFAAGSLDSAPFTVHLNTDSLVEGLEGIKVQLFNGATVLATTTGLIADANKVGQTFTLTPGLDSVGSGTQSDLVGSEGSTSVVGQDTIVVTENTANTFDFINGGPDVDTMRVLDAASPFTFAPNFTNITVQNVENLNYTSVRGLFLGNLNTTGWTGLQNTTLQLNSAATQTYTASAGMTSISITNAGSGGVTVQGGGGHLAITATTGNVNVGQNLANNTFTDATVTGGSGVNIRDNGAQELATVNLVGFTGNANLIGSAIANVSISGLNNGNNQTVNITADNPTVSLHDNADNRLDLNASNTLTVNAAGNTISGMGSITAGGSSLVINSTSGYLSMDDITANGGAATITLNDQHGGIFADVLSGPDLRTVNINGVSGDGYGFYINTIDGTNAATSLHVNITGGSYAQFGNVVEAPGGTVITATNLYGVTIFGQLGDHTQFNGSGDSGGDYVVFGANTTANTLGAGNDFVDFNSGTMGFNGVTFGSIDGGADFDIFRIDQHNAQTLTAQGNFLSNFEQAILTGGGAPGRTDTVNTANLGFGASPTNIVSNGASITPTQEVTVVSFAGTATGMTQGSSATALTADKVTFDGITVQFDDNASGANLSSEFASRYTAALGVHNYTVVDNGDGSVTITKIAGGAATDITAGSFTFTDVTNLGAPQAAVGNIGQGVNTVVATTETATLTLTDVTVAPGETVTISAGGVTTTYTNSTVSNITQNGGALADAIVAAVNGDAAALFTAVRSGNNVNFTAKAAGAIAPDLSVGGTGLGGGDVYSAQTTTEGVSAVAGSPETFDLTITGAGNANDTITFDGVTVTLNGTENTPNLVAADFAGFVSANWHVTGVVNNVVTFQNNNNGNVTDVTAASFAIVDDTNVGTPSIGSVNVTTQGDVGGLVLNNYSNAGTLEITGDGIFTVNLANATGSSDSLSLVLDGARTATITANGVETVNINTDTDIFFNTDTLTLNDAAAKSLVITGNDSLVLTETSTAITNFDASGLGGAVTWTSGALNGTGIQISTGFGGSTMHLEAAVKALTFTGGSGNDTVFLSNATNNTVNLGGGADTVTTGTGLNTLTLGSGHDTVNIAQTLNGNSYSSITDFSATSFSSLGGSGDKLVFADGTGTFVAAQGATLAPTAVFQDYLDAATAGPAGSIHWFQFQGNTYVVDDNSAAVTFQNGVDSVIQLQGLINLSAAAGVNGQVLVA